MPIIFTEGNILDDKSSAIVNPVNCVGVMGKGLAIVLRQKYPAMYNLYKKQCKQRVVEIGNVNVIHVSHMKPNYIINFPTKYHWRETSELSYIETGLDDLATAIIKCKIDSIAIPALGCGCGGLDWTAVSKLIVNKLSKLPAIITIYGPQL